MTLANQFTAVRVAFPNSDHISYCGVWYNGETQFRVRYNGLFDVAVRVNNNGIITNSECN